MNAPPPLRRGAALRGDAFSAWSTDSEPCQDNTEKPEIADSGLCGSPARCAGQVKGRTRRREEECGGAQRQAVRGGCEVSRGSAKAIVVCTKERSRLAGLEKPPVRGGGARSDAFFHTHSLIGSSASGLNPKLPESPAGLKLERRLTAHDAADAPVDLLGPPQTPKDGRETVCR